jgi:hypothetical protein
MLIIVLLSSVCSGQKESGEPIPCIKLLTGISGYKGTIQTVFSNGRNYLEYSTIYPIEKVKSFKTEK